MDDAVQRGPGAQWSYTAHVDHRWLLRVILAAVACVAIGCGKPADQQAYEDVVATMSMERAQRFFQQYPQSPYRDQLAEQLVAWCAREATGDCYAMLLDALPRDWAGYRAVATQYDAHKQRDGK